MKYNNNCCIRVSNLWRFTFTSQLLPSASKRQGNVFTQVCLSVILFKGGLCPSMHHRSHDRGVSVKGGVSVQRDLNSGGGLCEGGLSVQGVSVRETLPMVKSRRYASYWNAFLFFLSFQYVQSFIMTCLSPLASCGHSSFFFKMERFLSN